MGILNLLSDMHEAYLDTSRRAVYKRIHDPMILNLDDYFPSQIQRVVDRLEKNGMIIVEETNSGMKMTITEKGKKETFRMNLDEIKIKKGTWDGKWRIVLFDIEESTRSRRDKLRRYLSKLGFKQYQKSVFIGPYECEAEINYLREILKSPGEIKYGIIERFDDDADLKKGFDL